MFQHRRPSLVWCLCVLVSVWAAAPVIAADTWPQFRGPDGQGHSAAVGLPTEWSESSNITWKTPLPGTGWSSPVVADDRIWVTTATEEGHSLRAISIDLATGNVVYDVEVFRVDAPVRINAKNSHASPSPIIEGDRLYVSFGTMGSACLAADDGQVLWRNTSLQLDHKEGPGSSPISCGPLLFFACDGTDVQYAAALDKRTGELVWRTERAGATNPDPDIRKAYATPLLIESGGTAQVVSPGADRVYSYDPQTGQELWHVSYIGYSNVPRPVTGNGLVFICTGYNQPQLWAIRPDGRGDIGATNVVWKVTANVPANPSPIVIGQRIYMVSDKGIVTCVDAVDGREVFRNRLGGNYSASPLSADGLLYFSSEDGLTSVVEAGDEFRLVAKNQVEGRQLASLAVAGRAILLRTDTHLYRIENAQTAAGE